MNFAQTMRLIWIDAMIARTGTIRRADIATMFHISIPQASLDLGVYQKTCPGGITYDAKAKLYRRTSLECLYSEDARDAVWMAARHVHEWAMWDLTP